MATHLFALIAFSMALYAAEKRPTALAQTMNNKVDRVVSTKQMEKTTKPVYPGGV